MHSDMPKLAVRALKELHSMELCRSRSSSHLTEHPGTTNAIKHDVRGAENAAYPLLHFQYHVSPVSQRLRAYSCAHVRSDGVGASDTIHAHRSPIRYLDLRPSYGTSMGPANGT
jgi:hypothetical protein